MLELNRIYNQECIDGMKLIDDKSIDMILCDLPYGTTACKWDTIIPFDKLWEQYKRVIKDNGAIVLTASQPFTTKLISNNYDMFKYCLVWEKTKPTGFINAKNAPLKKHEDICIFSKGTTANKSNKRMNYFPQGLTFSGKTKQSKYDENDILGIRPSRKNDGYVQQYTNYPNSILKFQSENKTVHPTQKPVALFEYLIRTYTNEGETVLDNCMGSGTTAVACINTNRKFVGFELDEEYFKIANNRIGEAKYSLCC